MFCSIPGANIKVLNKTVEALSKLSDEVQIQCNENSMVFTAYNLIKTSYAKYTFNASLFLHYECKKEQANEPVSCKISNRCLMMVFKRKMEKRIESCKIYLKTGDENIVFHLRYKSGTTTIHTFHLLNWEYSSWDCDVDPDSNKVICKSGLLLNVLGNFKRKDIQLYVDATNDSIVLRNYGTGQNNLKTVHSQIKINRGEFNSYDVHNNCSFMMPVRALRSVISYADSLALHLLLSFTNGGSPLIITAEHENFHGYCVISTLSLDGSQSECSLQRHPSSTTTSLQRNVESCEGDMEVGIVDVSLGLKSIEAEQTHIFKRPRDIDNFALNKTNIGELHDNTVNTTLNPELMHIFGRCFDPTYHQSQLELGTVLCENSDTDSD